MSQTSKVALVTGAGSGIGRGCALKLLESGWHVFLAGRRMDTLNAVVDIARAADRSVVVACDVSREESVAALFSTNT